MITETNKRWIASYDARKRPEETFKEWAQTVKTELEKHAFDHMEFSTISRNLDEQHTLVTWAEFDAWAWRESDKAEFAEALTPEFRGQTAVLCGQLTYHPDLEFDPSIMHMWRNANTSAYTHLLEMMRSQLQVDTGDHNLLKYYHIPQLEARIQDEQDEEELEEQKERLEEMQRKLQAIDVNLKSLRYMIKLTVRIVKRERMTENSLAYRRHMFDLAW